MPTATLRYKLPDEQADFDAARQGGEAQSLLWRIDQYLRGIVKHGDPTPESRQLAEAIRTMIAESNVDLL